MQVVNQQCDVCTLRIASQFEGACCPDCSIFFHRDCLSTPDVCPQCRQGFDALASLQRSREEARTTSLIERGKYMTLFCAALLAAEHLLAVFLGLLGWILVEGYFFPVFEMATLPVTLVIVTGLFLGIGWFRMFTLIVLGIMIFTLLVFGGYGLTHGFSFFALGITAFRVVVYVAIFGVLTLSRSVSFYFGYYSH